MPKVSARLGQAGCRKRGCTARCGHPARHHRRHEAMWLGVWRHHRAGEPRWEAFVKRYKHFHPDDVVVLGANHHAEIHILYDIIIDAHKAATGLSLARYSWTQADDLMDRLEKAFVVWLSVPTPGFPYALFERLNLYRTARAERRKMIDALPRLERNAARKYERHREWLFQNFRAICTVQKAPTISEG